MRTIRYFLVLFLTICSLFFAPFSFAQKGMDHGTMASPANAQMSEGEVRKVNKEAGNLTIKHGEIKQKSFEMPPMTMEYTVKDKALLNSLSVGTKIRFMLKEEGGNAVISEIQKL